MHFPFLIGVFDFWGACACTTTHCCYLSARFTPSAAAGEQLPVGSCGCADTYCQDCHRATEGSLSDKTGEKTNIVRDGIKFCKHGIPDTTAGLYWNARLARISEEQEQEVTEDALQQAATDALKQQQKDARAFAHQQSTSKVLVALQNNEQSWQDTPAKELCDAANDLLKPQSKITRKGDAVASFQRALDEGEFSLAWSPRGPLL